MSFATRPEEKNSDDDEQMFRRDCDKKKTAAVSGFWEYSFGRPFGQLSMIEKWCRNVMAVVGCAASCQTNREREWINGKATS
jgi:hypothetical protein